ncbi:hypothetical protein ASZ90_005051 [hydrocarbon metagenome]|uniref:Uncharacterized protein n=1 Tax=hydrocarbon metagenome TaxID=938273 RepID=A0A0W8FW42_9ZZZZ
MALVDVNQGGRDAVANVYNGLSSSDYFWTYYTDEPLSIQTISQHSFSDFKDYVKNLHSNSNFAFGETNTTYSGFYTDNPYIWLGVPHTNYYPTDPDIIFCTRYENVYGGIDQRSLWDAFRSKYNQTFSRTWIAAHKDGSEFSQLLGYCMNNNIAPWFYQNEDVHDLSDGMLPQYCNAAWNAGFLDRYDKRFKVWYKCTLTHTHDPLHPGLCNWVEDRRVLEGVFLR